MSVLSRVHSNIKIFCTQGILWLDPLTATTAIWHFGIIYKTPVASLFKQPLTSVKCFSGPCAYPVTVTPLTKREQGWPVPCGLLRVNITSSYTFRKSITNIMEDSLMWYWQRERRETIRRRIVFARIVYGYFCMLHAHLLKCLKTRLRDNRFNF